MCVGFDAYMFSATTKWNMISLHPHGGGRASKTIYIEQMLYNHIEESTMTNKRDVMS